MESNERQLTMAAPFISHDRRAEILSHLASDAATEDAESAKSSYNKLYSKEQQKDQKDSKDGKDSKDQENSHAPGGTGYEEVIRAAGADAAANDEARAEMSVGQKWMQPTELEKRDPIV
jgi:hypothetical protein